MISHVSLHPDAPQNMSNEATINFYEGSNPEYRDYDIIPNFETKYGVSVQEDVDFTAFNRGRSVKDLKVHKYVYSVRVYAWVCN